MTGFILKLIGIGIFIYFLYLFFKWQSIQNSNPDYSEQSYYFYHSSTDMIKRMKEYPRISFKTFLKFYKVAPKNYSLYKNYIKRKAPSSEKSYDVTGYCHNKESDIGINLGFFSWLIYKVFYKLNKKQKEEEEKNKELKKLLTWVNQDIEIELKKEQQNINKCAVEIKRITDNMS